VPGTYDISLSVDGKTWMLLFDDLVVEGKKATLAGKELSGGEPEAVPRREDGGSVGEMNGDGAGDEDDAEGVGDAEDGGGASCSC
jgi:hypothetical protein